MLLYLGVLSHSRSFAVSFRYFLVVLVTLFAVPHRCVLGYVGMDYGVGKYNGLAFSGMFTVVSSYWSLSGIEME